MSEPRCSQRYCSNPPRPGLKLCVRCAEQHAAHARSEKGKASQRRYRQSEKGRAAHRRHREKVRAANPLVPRSHRPALAVAMYVEQRLPSTEIARRLGCSKQAVLKILKRADVERRGRHGAPPAEKAA